MDHFQTISRCKRGLRPCTAGYNLPIMFDGYTVGFERQLRDKLIEGARFLQFGKSTRLTVENKCEWHNNFSLAGVDAS